MKDSTSRRVLVFKRMQQAAQGEPDDWWVEVQFDWRDKDTRETVAELTALLNCLQRVRAEVLSGGVLRLTYEPCVTES
jgi:hypothetical protein